MTLKESKVYIIPFSPRDAIHFKKVEPANLSEKDFNIYEGKYFSEETNSSITILHESSELIIHLNADNAYQLIPTYKDAFKINELDCNVQFIKNFQHKITKIKFYFWRTKGIEFTK